MNKDTSPKHFTPNFRLVQRSIKRWNPITKSLELYFPTPRWEPVPLRQSRKDLGLGIAE